MEKKTQEVNIVHDDDLIQFLKNLGLLSLIHEEKIKCKFCKSIIKLDTINSIFPEEKNIKVCCNEPNCVTEFANYLNKNDK